MAADSIDVVLSKIVFHKPSKFSKAGVPFLIGRTTAGQTIKGDMRKPVEGERYRLIGEWKTQRGYNEPAFEFVAHDVVIDESESGIIRYLWKHVDGIGPSKAAAIVNEFGTDTLDVLRCNPDVAMDVKGITREIIDSIIDHFAETKIDPVAYARMIDLFSGHKIPERVVKKLLEEWGSDAPEIVRERPYMLLAFPRLGWKTVDALATTNLGYALDGIDRHKFAIVEALTRISNQGHTWADKPDTEREAFALLGGIPSDQAWSAITNESLAYVECDWVDEDARFYSLSEIASAERTIALRLASIARSATPLPFSLDDTGLNVGQQAALRMIEKFGLVIVSGAPGVGKTFAVTRALAGLVKSGFQSIRFVAPTGKAAKRAANLLRAALPDSGIEPSTIHRALGPVPSDAPEGVPASDSKTNRGREEFGFAHNEESPIETQVLVCDETSMLDVSIGASLFKAVADGTRVILVGDPNQLPSVGPGSVLRDLIDAGVPTATLTEVQRNAGRIVKACHAIKDGRTPEPSDRVDIEAGENWVHLEISDPAEIARQIVELHLSAGRNGRFDPVWDMQVISPEKAKPGVGCDHLNRVLSAALNWEHPASQDGDGPTPAFRPLDKVVRTKNGIVEMIADDGSTVETDIVNGDMGIVKGIEETKDGWFVEVDFVNPARRCRLPYSESHLIQAYAMTAHKAQGSGFPYVLLPVHDSFYYDRRTGQGLWNREMIYTMFSRAERLLVTVGSFQAIRSAVSRPTVNRRRTRLKGLISPAFAETREEVSCD